MTEYLRGRQKIYEYLYMAYYKVPDADFIKATKEFSNIFTMLGAEIGGEIDNGDGLLAAFLKENAHISDEELAGRLNFAFTKLFIKGNSDICKSERHWRCMEKTAEDIIVSVSNYFADANAVKPTEINLPIDSYSMELFYLYHTSKAAAENEGEARYKILEEQLNFINDHILCWTDKFTGAVIEKTDSANFYHPLAYLSNGFIKYDFNTLSG